MKKQDVLAIGCVIVKGIEDYNYKFLEMIFKFEDKPIEDVSESHILDLYKNGMIVLMENMTNTLDAEYLNV